MSSTTTPFPLWLRAQRTRRDTVGEFARDAMDEVRTGCLPRVPADPDVLAHHYASQHRANDTMRKALTRTVTEYREDTSPDPVEALLTHLAAAVDHIDETLTVLAATLRERQDVP